MTAKSAGNLAKYTSVVLSSTYIKTVQTCHAELILTVDLYHARVRWSLSKYSGYITLDYEELFTCYAGLRWTVDLSRWSKMELEYSGYITLD